MVSFKLVFTKEAQKDAKKIKSAGLKNKCEKLLNIINKNPFQNPPPYEQLIGNIKGSFSRRINIKHRLVYQVSEEEKAVKVIRVWTNYE